MPTDDTKGCFTRYATPADNVIYGNAGSRFFGESFEVFNELWATTFLPSGDLLVIEKAGALLMMRVDDRSKVLVKGVPRVAYAGQILFSTLNTVGFT